jgi:hypothetical protein
MKENEYIIVNKNKILDQISYFKQDIDFWLKCNTNPDLTLSEDAISLRVDSLNKRINSLYEILEDSVDLTPELEKAIYYGAELESGNIKIDFKNFGTGVEQYVATLELNI